MSDQVLSKASNKIAQQFTADERDQMFCGTAEWISSLGDEVVVEIDLREVLGVGIEPFGCGGEHGSFSPWPDEMLSLAHGLYMISVDVLSAFGNVCVLHVGFYPRFLFQMCFLPAVYLATWLVYRGVLRFSATRCTKRAALFTAESVRTKATKLLFIMTYALYTSVSTTIFRLFKCQNVQGRWYLTADYRLRCFEGVWYLYASLAIAGIAVYTIGIPLMLFVVLRRNRRYLYESTCPRDQMHRHAEVKRRLGLS